MVLKIPFSKAESAVKGLIFHLELGGFEAKVEATEKKSIELIIQKRAFILITDDHYYIPVGQDNLVDWADVDTVTGIAKKLVDEHFTKLAEIENKKREAQR